MKTRWMSAAVALAFLFFQTQGQAQGRTHGVASAAPASEAHEGRQHYDRGIERYTLADFETAIEEFKKAYELTHAPALLFNLAQASRLAKQYEPALHFYRAYLRALPTAANRADAEKFIDELEVRLRDPFGPPPVQPTTGPPVAAAVAAPATVPASPVAAPLAPARAVPVAGRDDHRLLVAGGVTAGVGLALLAPGIYFGVTARSDASQLSSLAAQGGAWSGAAQRTYDEGRRDARLSTAFLAVGGVVLGAGAVVTVIGARRRAGHSSRAVARLLSSEETPCAF